MNNMRVTVKYQNFLHKELKFKKKKVIKKVVAKIIK